MSPMLNPHTNQPDPQKVGAERWGFLISQSNEFPEAVLHLAESSSSSSKQQINTNDSNNINTNININININILLLLISTFNVSSHLYNHISLFLSLLWRVHTADNVIGRVSFWRYSTGTKPVFALILEDARHRSSNCNSSDFSDYWYLSLICIYIYIIYKTRIGMDEWYYMHQQKPPNLYQCWVLWKLPGGTVLQIRADMRNRLMDLKSRSTPRAFNAIDPKILWFSWCYHSVFLLSEIFWEVLCSGKVMKTLWHQMEYWNVHSLFWGKLLLHRKWQHLVTLIERGQTFGFVMTKKFSDFVTLLYCRLCCSSRKCAGGEHACWSKDSDLNSC